MTTLFAPDVLLRLPLYSALGLVAEVLFTGVVDLINPGFLQSWNAKELVPRVPDRRDPRAVGYTFLWMVPLYALLVFVEPLARGLADWPLWARGFVYLPLFWIGEYLSGALIKKLVGRCPWDYSYSRWSVHGFIRWDYAPIWYAFTLLVEVFSRHAIALTPALKALS